VIDISIQKPFSISVKGLAIDASEVNTITWKVSGAIQTSYSIEFKRNSDNLTVFSVPKTNSYSTTYQLPANSLINGNEYKILITVYDETNSSATSDAEIFSTSSRPIVSLSTVTTVKAPWYNFQATYSQAQSIAIKSWIANLYDSNQVLIKQSGIQTTSPLQYLFDGLVSGKSYYIEFQATSNKGLIGSTGLKPFSVLYAKPNMSVDLTAINTDNGGVKLAWGATQIIGQSENGTFENNEKLNVTNGKVTFSNGFNIQSDFTAKLWIENVPNPPILDNTQTLSKSSAPSNFNAIWLEDSNQTTEKSLTIVASKTQPIDTNTLWIDDASLTSSYTLTAEYNLATPATNALWVEAANIKDTIYLMKMSGDNGYLTLDYYNGKFVLSKYENNIKTKVAERIITGSKFYVYIQQIGDTYRLSAQVIA